MSISISDPKFHIRMPGCNCGSECNISYDSGLINFDRETGGNMTGILDISAKNEYYIGMQVYIGRMPDSGNVALTSHKINYTISTGAIEEGYIYAQMDKFNDPKLLIHVQGTIRKSMCIGNLPSGDFSGWQYFGFSVNITVTASALALQCKFHYYDPSTWDLSSISITSGTSTLTLDHGAIGRLAKEGDYYDHLVGAMRLILICDEYDDSECIDIVFPNRNSSLYEWSFQYYRYSWDFTTNSTFDSIDRMANYDTRSLDHCDPEIKFFNSDPLVPVYPTHRGWFSPSSEPNLIFQTLPFIFYKTRTWTIMFEVMVLEWFFDFTLYLHDSNGSYEDGAKMRFTSISTSGENPLFATQDVVLAPYVMHKVFITKIADIDADQYTLEITVLKLTEEGANTFDSQSYTSGLFDSSVNPLDSADEAEIAFSGFYGLLKSLRFYHWPVNRKTIGEIRQVHGSSIGTYEYSDPTNETYTFQQSVFDDYYKKVNKYENSIKNDQNVCKAFFHQDQNICMDLSSEEKDSCHSHYTLASTEKFQIQLCIEKCGDGVHRSDPQIFYCDLNPNSGYEGCTETCMKEVGYQCIPTVSSRSYCYNLCGDGVYESLEGEFCDDGNLFDGDGCSSTCTIEPGFFCINSDVSLGNPQIPSDCRRNCGNGVRDTVSPDFEICDDNNNLDGDGCSSTCQIEAGYECSQVNGIDICSPILTVPEIVEYSADTLTDSISIRFNTEMQNTEIGDLDFNFIVSGPKEQYNAVWEAVYTSDYDLKITYTITPDLVGVTGEEITIEIVNSLSFISQEGLKMVQVPTLTMDVSDPNSSEGVETASKGAAVAFILGLAITLGVSIVTGGSIELMWSFTNTLQILFFFGLMNLHFSSDLKSVFDFMSYSNFKNPLRDIISDFINDIVTIPGNPVNTNFAEMGFPQTNIIANSIDKLLALGSIVSCMVAISCLIKYTEEYDNKWTRFLKKIDIDLRYNSVVRFMLELILYMSISCFITIFYGDLSSFMGIIAFAVAIGVFTILLCFQFYTMMYPLANFELMQFDPVQLNRHQILFEVFKSDNPHCLMYYFYFISRRFWLAVMLVVYKDHTSAQVITIAATNVVICKYHLSRMPFKSTLDNILACINESILVVFSSLLWMFLDVEKTSQIVMGSYVMIGMIAAFFFVNWGIIIPAMVKTTFWKQEQETMKENKPTVAIKMSREQKERLERLERNKKNKLVPKKVTFGPTTIAGHRKLQNQPDRMKKKLSRHADFSQIFENQAHMPNIGRPKQRKRKVKKMKKKMKRSEEKLDLF